MKLNMHISWLHAVKLADCTHGKFQFISNFSISSILSPGYLISYYQDQSYADDI